MVQRKRPIDREMDEIYRKVIEMGSIAQKSILLAVESFKELDKEKAKKVFEMDKEIYCMSIEIEQKTLELIALRAPVAGDLRKVGTIMKIITNIARIGRYASDIAEVTVGLEQTEHFKNETSLTRMAELVVQMVNISLNAFMQSSKEKINELNRMEEEVDELFDRTFKEVFTYVSDDPKKMRTGIAHSFVARYLERVGDHAQEIMERVSYMVSGERIIHDVKGMSCKKSG